MIKILDPPTDTDELENGVDVTLPTWCQSLLRDNGYQWDIKSHQIAINLKPEKEDSVYHLVTIETTSVPFEQSDVVADSIEIMVCQCASQVFYHSPENPEQTIEDFSRCKHGKKARDKSAKAKEDPNQSELE